MNYEEAITCIKANICYEQECCSDGICKSTEDRPCAIDVAIEALEKQIPKKVIPFENNPYLDACPCCGRIKSIYGDRYCSYCGQRIDWSEVE